MLKDLIWQMFKNTGDIDYFIPAHITYINAFAAPGFIFIALSVCFLHSSQIKPHLSKQKYISSIFFVAHKQHPFKDGAKPII